ncbi:MAG: 1-acyl-sn-glycerol-3-phosphate acyltransferase [Saprospiraceae bacterium]|nr:1-acyl-sn-glycerol-3-phosphate acyltransferase [Saprospiraceae bacterium]
MKFSLRHKSTGKLYPYLEPFTPLMFPAYFKKTYVYDADKVPSDKPVLIAANHPTAFIEPLLLCTSIDSPLYNMARGDIFQKPFFRKLMESINMLPVYRKRDGFSENDRNDEVFDYVIEKMKDNQVVSIYVEGEHHSDKRVSPVKKGIARIAFAAFEKHALNDLQIIPAGINYTNEGLPRSSVYVNFGKPIFVRDYWPTYQVSPSRAILNLCRDIEAKLKESCYQIDAVDDDLVGDQMLEVYRSNTTEKWFPPVVHGSQDRFLEEKQVLNRLNAADTLQKDELKRAASDYFNSLSAAGLKDDALCHPKHGRLGKLFGYALGFIPFLIGRLGTYPVLGLAKYVADKKVSKKEFYGSVRIGVGFISGLLYFPLVIVVSLFSGKAIVIGLALLLPVLGLFAMSYRESFLAWKEARKAKAHPERDVLLEKRASLMQLWDKL